MARKRKLPPSPPPPASIGELQAQVRQTAAKGGVEETNGSAKPAFQSGEHLDNGYLHERAAADPFKEAEEPAVGVIETPAEVPQEAPAESALPAAPESDDGAEIRGDQLDK